ncbi:hypothetical protein FACS189411_07910 [Bacteroidia bacterium]|nr:hypothetical protein FACS189411_07910 [Bacteroidia bacterium]
MATRRKELDRRNFLKALGAGAMVAYSGRYALGSPVFQASNADLPKVYMTRDITPAGMMAAYNALGSKVEGKVAVKLSTGEPGGHNFLSPDLIKDLVQSVGGTIVECNTAYGGRRSSTASHKQAAAEHGFTAIATVDIMDEQGSMSLPVTGGRRLSENFVGSHFANYDSFLALSHFKGHAMAGFGGALKNISIGIASTEGKCWIHSGGKSRTSPWGGEQTAFLESMAEASKAVINRLNGKILFVNVMNNLSIDCDCDSHPATPEIPDIGILASTDPVALDKACIDLIYAADAAKSASLRRRIEQQRGTVLLTHAESLGLGSQQYEIVDITSGTANQEITASNIRVISNTSSVTILNAAGKKAIVTNIQGQSIANAVLSSDNATPTVPRGAIIVTVEGETAVKTIVK